MEEDDSHIGSPSPPYEGVITEEPEKQLESQGGDFDVKHLNGEVDEVNIFTITHIKNFHSMKKFHELQFSCTTIDDFQMPQWNITKAFY
jgi:hypothetical protein